MLEGTSLRLRILAPTQDDPIARTATVKISDTAAEFNDAAFFDLSGDPYYVVPARLDVTGARLSYRVLDPAGSFLDVDDDTGFNGYQMTFMGLRSDDSISIWSVDVISGTNTLEIPEDNMTFTRDTIWVNVDGLSYQRGEGVAARIGFRIDGTSGADRLRGDIGDDLLVGRAGADRLVAVAGDDRLLGQNGHDQLFGGTGGDTLMGGAGDDSLLGEAGHDLLRGDGGADRFVFSGNFGRDRIVDFDPGQQGERLDLRQVSQIRNFRDLEANHLSERDGDAVIQTGAGSTIRLVGVAMDDLGADDFLF